MSLNAKNILILGFVVSLLIAIPVTVYFLQKQQQTTSKATASTSLCFTKMTDNICLDNTNKPTYKVKDTFNLDVLMKPGTNNVIATTLNIKYDPTKVATSSPGFRLSNAFSSVIEGPIYTDGNISVTMSVGIDVDKVIKADTKIATVFLEALSPTGDAGTDIKFDQTTVTSTVSDPETNVLSTSTPAKIIITGSGVTPTPSVTTPTPTSSISTPNVPPVCTSLNIDRAASGSAPLSVTFTTVGNDSDGTIQKATFNFGDGPVEDVTVGGGIGTNSVSVQKAHTYNNPGTYTAKAVLTDNSSGISASDNCTQVIAVEPGVPTPTGIGGPIIQPTSTPLPTPTLAAVTPMPSPGPGGIIIGIGAAGVILSIIAGAIFLAL